jgi:phosphoglycolate phosphatase
VIERLLCDFDGTLVDSCASILETLRSCLAQLDLQPQTELSPSLIGPPLRSMVRTVLGPAHADRAPALESAFREEYDRRGHLRVHAYPGVDEVLPRLRDRGIALHLVTNKRILPTRLILERLGWGAWFASVHSLDSTPGAATKSDVVARMRLEMAWSAARAALVGDSPDDAAAARRNQLLFAWAGWGYGTRDALAGAQAAREDAGVEPPGAGVVLAAPEDLIALVSNRPPGTPQRAR